MSALDTLFRDLRAAKRKALMPFVTAGDPDLQFTADLLRCLIARGSSLCELGIPYSDPIADGPVIQSSYTRALQHKVKLAEIFDMLGRVTPELKAPLVSMVSYSIIYRQGLEAYVTAARKAGLAGAIVPDLPAEESAALAEVCRRQDFSLIQLIAPTTPRERALRIAERTSGFIYYVSVTGITGERTELPPAILDNVAWLRGQTPAADLHRFRHQPARARADARAGGRRPDRRFGDRASPGRGLDPTAGGRTTTRSATMSPSCSPRWSSQLAFRRLPVEVGQNALGCCRVASAARAWRKACLASSSASLFGHQDANIGMSRGGTDHFGKCLETLVESSLPGKDQSSDCQCAFRWFGSIARALQRTARLPRGFPARSNNIPGRSTDQDSWDRTPRPCCTRTVSGAVAPGVVQHRQAVRDGLQAWIVLRAFS